jgi:hypothetical protein
MAEDGPLMVSVRDAAPVLSLAKDEKHGHCRHGSNGLTMSGTGIP